MATATVRKSGKARKAKASAKKATSFERLWLACRLMTLSRDEYAEVYKDLHGFPRNILSGNKFASKFSRESNVPRQVDQLPDARIHTLLEKVRLIHLKRHEQQRTRRLERRSKLYVGRDGGYGSDSEVILKLTTDGSRDENAGLATLRSI